MVEFNPKFSCNLFTILIPYRNRDIEHVKNSFKSLKDQTCTNFTVNFIDYGSLESISSEVKRICNLYPSIQYEYIPSRDQPWNKSKALNSVIKNLTTDFCFVADVDMIFHPQFVEKARTLQENEKSIYFQVGFLEESNTKDASFDKLDNYRKSTHEATGLSMFPVKVLKEIRGFDEFYHFWGAEDTDIHVRLKNAGYKVEFYDKEVLILHQWHPSYRSTEKNRLTKDLQVSGIVQINHQHLKFAKRLNRKEVNLDSWGACLTDDQLKDLERPDLELSLSNELRQIENFLYGQLPAIKGKTLRFTIEQDAFSKSLKYKIKKSMGKKVPGYYTLKEINDLVLLHLISFYRSKPYTFKINDEGNQQLIEVRIKT